MERFDKLITDMSVHAQSEYPKESCGLILRDMIYVPCKNISTMPKESFILDPIALLQYEEDIWGIMHSHPGEENPLPSEDDVAHTVFDEYKFVVGFAGKFFVYWFDKKLESLRYEPLEVRHFGKDKN